MNIEERCGGQLLDSPAQGEMCRAELAEIASDGSLIVRRPAGVLVSCDVVVPAMSGIVLAIGDEVLALLPFGGTRGVVLGRIGVYGDRSIVGRVQLEATDSLSLKCGEASIDLSADGKVMIRGEDVLVRAKGTQRIRAGTVSIN